MPTPQNGQTHSNNLSAFDNKLFECVWLDHFVVLALRVSTKQSALSGTWFWLSRKYIDVLY